MSTPAPFDVVEASLEQIQKALITGSVTSVELVAQYLRRISIYDCRGICLNSVPVINQNVLEEAVDSDDRRTAGECLGPLDGIPYTVKDSFKVKGMTVANGSPAFQHLVSTEDAFTVQALRQAGAVLLGKTNMPPMAAGGMQRGVYGRAESPYNPKYLAAAFGSGSSNGSAVSTSASFAAFGLGEETVSSGRSPASNNSLVAYTPSRGNISVRGNWPLYSLCDVVVPHTRSMADLFAVLDVISKPDSITRGDFWRHQTLTTLPKPWPNRPKSFYDLKNGPPLQNLRIAAPEMYTQGTSGAVNNMGVFVSASVQELWGRAKADLEALGAQVIPVADFPPITKYEFHTKPSSNDTLGLPQGWKLVERGQLPALAWEEFLSDNNDPNLKTIHGVDPKLMWPLIDPKDPQMCFANPENAVHWANLSGYLTEMADHAPQITSQYQMPGLKDAIVALEEMRKTLFEDWMAANKFDFVAFPAAGDVGHADSDVSMESARHSWLNGVKYSNGNQALRHLGIPSITVPMGVIDDKQMPVGMTILGRAYDDVDILRLGYLYEQASKRRSAPPLTPSLPYGVEARVGANAQLGQQPRPRLHIEKCTLKYDDSTDLVQVSVEGLISMDRDPNASETLRPELQISLDGELVSPEDIDVESVTRTSPSEPSCTFSTRLSRPAPPPKEMRNTVHEGIARGKVIVVVLATVGNSKPSGWFGLLG